jgi:enoyl-CoA hydratase/carnithine racemase
MPSRLFTERRGPALVMTLSDPATRNSLSPQACAAGVEAVAGAEADDEIRCLVLRGDGAHFCAGGNLQRLLAARQASPAQQADAMEAFHGFVEALAACPKPTIAAVEGHAAGGGFSLALACDWIVASEAARFTMSYGRIGASPDGGATWALGRRVPRAVALALLWLPEAQPPQRLAALGLVHHVCGEGAALDTAIEVAERLAAMAPNAVASAKALIDAAPAAATLREQLDAERDHFVKNLFHANAGEGVQAFLDKRPPRFR